MIHVLGLDAADAGRSVRADEARAFASARHQAHGGDDPAYLRHLDEVHAIAAVHGLPDAVRVAAYLHELLMNADASEEELLECFGPEVLVLVDGVTGRGATRREQLEDVVRKLRAFPPAILLEMCDRLAGTWSGARADDGPLLDRYRAEWRTLQPVFAEMRKPAPALYQRLLDVSEGASGFYAGDRVRLVKVRPDVVAPLKLGDTGIVQGVQETFQPERMVQVLVDGQSEARALWPDELAHVR